MIVIKISLWIHNGFKVQFDTFPDISHNLNQKSLTFKGRFLRTLSRSSPSFWKPFFPWSGVEEPIVTVIPVTGWFALGPLDPPSQLHSKIEILPDLLMLFSNYLQIFRVLRDTGLRSCTRVLLASSLGEWRY